MVQKSNKVISSEQEKKRSRDLSTALLSGVVGAIFAAILVGVFTYLVTDYQVKIQRTILIEQEKIHRLDLATELWTGLQLNRDRVLFSQAFVSVEKAFKGLEEAKPISHLVFDQKAYESMQESYWEAVAEYQNNLVGLTGLLETNNCFFISGDVNNASYKLLTYLLSHASPPYVDYKKLGPLVLPLIEKWIEAPDSVPFEVSDAKYNLMITYREWCNNEDPDYPEVGNSLINAMSRELKSLGLD